MRLLPFPLPNSIVGKSILSCLAISFFIITFMKYYHVSHFLNFKFITISHYFSLHPPKKAEINLYIIEKNLIFNSPFIKKALAWQQISRKKIYKSWGHKFSGGTQLIPSVIITMHWTIAMCQAVYWMLSSYDLM